MAEASFNSEINLPAIRGVQAGREYYVIMSQLSMLPRLFRVTPSNLPAELKAQRTLNRSRIPQLVRYINENPTTYVFSSLAASVDGELIFTSLESQGKLKAVGLLTIPAEARFLVNDGQHRLAALQSLLAERPKMGSECISIVIYADSGLHRSQQMFADLNRYAVRPTRSLNILYDHRDPLAVLSRNLADSVPVFKNLTEMTANTISNRERKLFTLNAIYHATQHLLGKRARDPVSREEQKLAELFWTAVGTNMPDWSAAANEKCQPSELRKTCVHAHGIALQAIGIAGNALLTHERRHWKRSLLALSQINWKRSNHALWEGRAMSGAKICKAGNHLTLTVNVIKKALGLPLSEAEAAAEQAHESARIQLVNRHETSNPDARPSKRTHRNGRGALPSRRKAVGGRL